MILIKTHRTQNKEILAICDSQLLGKKYEENGKILDLTSDFYNGEERREEEIGDLMRNADIVNIVGEKSIKIALKENIIDQSHIKKIDNIEYAQILNVFD